MLVGEPRFGISTYAYCAASLSGDTDQSGRWHGSFCPSLAVQSPTRLVVHDVTNFLGWVWTTVNSLPSGAMNMSKRVPSV